MTTNSVDFKVYKKVLKNGLTVLARRAGTVPRVEVNLWYAVGSKHERTGQRGMAHLIEHMLFKGTHTYSETDINLIMQKLSGDANAFTMQDATCYTFSMPRNAWVQTLPILADCMNNALFDPQMLASEVQAVIEELKMYADDYQNTALESLIGAMFSGHAYAYPIIGAKHDLCGLTRDDLFAFYKEHYHPGNATLVVVGPLSPEEVFEQAEKYFQDIPVVHQKAPVCAPFSVDVGSRSVTLYRPVTTPWVCFLYPVPGLRECKAHLFDIAGLILANGKSSRLYQTLVEKERVAQDVQAFCIDLFDYGVFGISVSPLSVDKIPHIQALVHQELERFIISPIKDWEFIAAQKRACVDFSSLLENNEQQASLIGSLTLATGDERYVQTYFSHMIHATLHDVQEIITHYFRPSAQNAGYVLPLPPREKKYFMALQASSDLLDKQILSQFVRTMPMQDGRMVDAVTVPGTEEFSFPHPEHYMIDNGLELLLYNNPSVPQVCAVLNLKVSHLHDPSDRQGITGFLFEALAQETKKYTAQVLHKMLEMHGIYISPATGAFTIRCLPDELERALELVTQMLTQPRFAAVSIEKIREQLSNDIKDFQDTPFDLVNQLAKDVMYNGHACSNNPYGSLESFAKITKKELQDWHEKFCSPHDADLVVVGDLAGIDVPAMVKRTLGEWTGQKIPDLVMPPVIWPKPGTVMYPADKDQTVLAFVAPSIPRTDKRFLMAALLDTVVTGGSSASPTSRLFALREKSGLFYTIGGSLLFDAAQEPGIILIKTIVSPNKVDHAIELILDAIDTVGRKGILEEEFLLAQNALKTSSIQLFESNMNIAKTFLFIKKQKLSFDLFDKQGQDLSILKLYEVNELARELCNRDRFSVIHVGRTKKSMSLKRSVNNLT